MDPTETELVGITNLAGVYTWAGVTGRLQAALQEALGDPALSKHAITDDGLPCVKARKLIHVRRIAPALRWIRALLASSTTLERIFYANPPVSDLELVTDAPPWGIGGVCRLRGQAVGYFYSHLPDEHRAGPRWD